MNRRDFLKFGALIPAAPAAIKAAFRSTKTESSPLAPQPKEQLMASAFTTGVSENYVTMWRSPYMINGYESE